MRFSSPSILLFVAIAISANGEQESNIRILKGKKNNKLKPLPINDADFDEPLWEAIIERAFPPWKVPDDGCPTYDKVEGTLISGSFPTPEKNKFNPCYYTKAFAGLDPSKGGYPSPIDTHYPYEFAAPFLGQPGDGSVKHCPIDSDSTIDVGSCPKLGQCPGVKDCAVITDEYGIGHIPPFVPLAAVKNAYQALSRSQPNKMCADWFNYETDGCNIKKSVLDELVLDQFGEDLDGETVVKFPPPILIDGVPSKTYYRLEYINEKSAYGEDCGGGTCKGPHYCSDPAVENVWGDFCPYVMVGENSGQYRHPHVALAALELWIANQCMPEVCPKRWLHSPNGQDYQTDPLKSTSITWAEMKDNNDPVSQPKDPYEWPNTAGLEDGIFPGKDLYAGKSVKPAPGMYVTEFVAC
eukprot:CAMPEP_0185726460 /NCGR_PEP_ID=MMETSP1171-20130828/2441_1 /TAXON_ID=374046 /ORGANISM="Helicotheca tamensis, Strain CCMP826" /LENGTH=409 /DNA_ID=CAMNT_0028394827 /DNA_START=20 /DNA_END=1249 /DNA_ORIENTATION=+